MGKYKNLVFLWQNRQTWHPIYIYIYFLILVINELPRGIKSLPDLFLGNYISLFGSISPRRVKWTFKTFKTIILVIPKFFFFFSTLKKKPPKKKKKKKKKKK